jgi:hypothetical protein
LEPLSSTITRLEAVGAQLHDSLEPVQGAESQIEQAHGKVADRVSKLKNVLFRNNGYSTLCKISEILSGNEAQLEDDKPALNSNDLTFFKYAPVTLCDVERSFSCYKTILSDNRRSFTFESLKMHVFI